MKCKSASRVFAKKKKDDLGTVHLTVYIFPLKDLALIILFFFYRSLANLSGKTDLHCAAKILRFSKESWVVATYQFLSAADC